MNTKRTSAAAVTAALAGALAAGCSSGGGSSTGASSPVTAPQQSTAPSPANPVPIVKQAGAVTTAKYGETDVYGDRYAGGDLPGTGKGCTSSYTDDGKCLEYVEAYTFTDEAALQADLARNDNGAPTDSQVTIRGDLFDITVYSVSTNESENSFPVSPSVIAQRVHGTVITG